MVLIIVWWYDILLTAYKAVTKTKYKEKEKERDKETTNDMEFLLDVLFVALLSPWLAIVFY